MKILLSFLMFSSLSFGCSYYVDKEYVFFDGYEIDFSQTLEKMMNKLGYEKTQNTFEADTHFSLEYETEQRERFMWIVSDIKVDYTDGSTKTITNEKWCYTIACSLPEVKKALLKNFKKAKKKIRKCPSL